MPYEQSIGVPLVVVGPDIPDTLDQGKMVAVNLDIPATIYSLYGIEAPTEGISIFAPQDSNRKVLIEDYGYLEWRRNSHGDPLPSMVWSGIRTENWKYIEWATGETELFDLRSDPQEMDNLVLTSHYASTVDELRNTLSAERGLAIISGDLPDAMVTSPYRFEMQAWGGKPPLKWKVVSGKLPSGVLLDPNTGLVQGIPQTSGTYSFDLRVTDTGEMKHSGRPEYFMRSFQIKVE